MGCWVAVGHTPLIHRWGYVPLPRINKLKKPTNWPFLGHKDRFIKWQHPSAPLINCTGEGDRAAHTASGDTSLQCHWLGDTVGILRKPRGHEKIPELPPLTLLFFSSPGYVHPKPCKRNHNAKSKRSRSYPAVCFMQLEVQCSAPHISRLLKNKAKRAF